MPGGPIDWVLAEKIAVRVARTEPIATSYHYDSVRPDFSELTPLAERLVAAETGLESRFGPASAQVVDRAGWVRANITSFQQLLGPLLDKLDSPIQVPFDIARHAARTTVAVEVGTLLGWMSSRVLGQYDALGAAGIGDELLIVGPNVLALEKRYGFPPREFRLWLALHEVTHRMQFTGVPWMRDHFVGLVHEILDDVEPDAKRLLQVVRLLTRPAAARRVIESSGLFGLFASPAQRSAIASVGGMMALLEGHGDIVMNRAGAGHVPSADRFHRALSSRRQNASPVTRLVRTALGVEAKMAQYEQGERFINAVEAEAGPQVIDRCWERADHLPSLDEIREPALWLARLGISSPR